jgi:fatty acid desaturase
MENYSPLTRAVYGDSVSPNQRFPRKISRRQSSWLPPLKRATLDLGYLHFYLRPSVFMKRPKSERGELCLALFFGAVIFTIAALAGWLNYYLLLFIIPTRFTAVTLALSIDFLPHYPHQAQKRNQPFQSTSNRVGFEWLLTPILLYQNYHLVHHIYPTVSFLRYPKVGQAKKHYHASQDPAIVDAFVLEPRKTLKPS